jgi:hypothetical protein
VSNFTYRNIIILMETIEDLYIARLPRAMGDLSLAVQCGQLGICTMTCQRGSAQLVQRRLRFRETR